MKKNRYLLCLLLAVAFIYYALPRLSIEAVGMEGIFSISWLTFALIVIAGNLSALLFLPKKQSNVKNVALAKSGEAKRLRAR